MKSIFIVDDEENIRELIRKYLEREGYQVTTFSNAQQVMERLRHDYPDMFILDVMMPGMDGLELCKTIRERGQTPIIFVSAKDEEVDKILGLELGGDDYLAKPFSPRELVARVKTVFRRQTSVEKGPLISVNDLTINPGERRVLVQGQEVELTNKEYQLLSLLAGHLNRAFSREELLDKIWGFDYVGDIRAVDDLVKRVRRKLREKRSQVEITTVWGYGYKIND